MTEPTPDPRPAGVPAWAGQALLAVFGVALAVLTGFFTGQAQSQKSNEVEIAKLWQKVLELCDWRTKAEPRLEEAIERLQGESRRQDVELMELKTQSRIGRDDRDRDSRRD